MLPAFRMSRYLITYKQFQAFIDALDGWSNPIWWEGLSMEEQHKRQSGNQAFKYWNHPRERVSWYDAVAFCRWLSTTFGYQIALPTEQQYERATDWMDGREYPKKVKNEPETANTFETNIGRTSAVGIFPDGESLERIYDLNGNVWEWCLNKYKYSEDTSLHGSDVRILRGGSWYNSRSSTFAIHRDFNFPSFRSYNFGFRVVASVANTEQR